MDARFPPTSGPAAEEVLPTLAESAFETIDRTLHAALATATAGLSPMAIAGAGLDWAMHLAGSPGRQLQLASKAVTDALENAIFAGRAALGVAADPNALSLDHDSRFRDEAWESFPFDAYAHAFLSIERWWEAATTGVRGVSRDHEAVTTFCARQFLDTVAPTNFILTNPQALKRTSAEVGLNLMRGAVNAVEDVWRSCAGLEPAGTEAFRVGETVALTPGKVVHRNRLAEIIQYAPSTGEVRPEPVVIVPAWIMKYYILDLSPANSLVRYLTGQGFTVFMVSWKNPGAEDCDLGLDDYRRLGVMPAIEAAATITGQRKVHAVGYCLGGTLLAIAAAAMARDGDDRLASLTLFAAQADFTEAGELRLFINESQVAFLEDMMWERGYLEAAQMAGAFQMLRSNDLIWSRLVHEYLMGNPPKPIDIMAWNADATRMPYRMHSEYLRQLFLDNDLAEGRLEVDGRAVMLRDIRAPIFAVATEEDHVAPWRSVFKLHVLAGADVTFLLTSGGHNAGILSEPGHPRRHFRHTSRGRNEGYIAPDEWLEATPVRPGSWWPAFVAWLTDHSGPPTAPPSLGLPGTQFAALGDAPGDYVRMR